MPKRALDPSVARVAQRLQGKLELLIEDVVDLVESEIDFYRLGSVVSRAQLRRSVAHNLTYLLGHIAGTDDSDLAAPRETGRRRPKQEAPLLEILRAHRLAFAFLWKRLLAETRQSGESSLNALLDTASDIWELADDYSLALVEAYRRTRAESMVAADRKRSALVATPIGDRVRNRDSTWEVAKLLDFPYEGRFLVVVAETSTIGVEALPGLEDQLRRTDDLLAFPISTATCCWRPPRHGWAPPVRPRKPGTSCRATRTLSVAG